MNSQKRIFSGIQPSGNLHIGNYLGAIKNWVKLQDEFESIFCVVDMHAITVSQDPKELQKRVMEVAKIYLASGIDPKKSAIFIQSQISEHAELAWVLNTIAKMPELDKMTQFKEKAKIILEEDAISDAKELLKDIYKEAPKNMEELEKRVLNIIGANQRIVAEKRSKIGVGLYDYPVLMAADILLYDAEKVPVGEDQVQHVELTRTLGKRFNSKFGETFVIPEPLLVKEGMRIMGLDDPSKKMSKSAASEYNWIALTDDAETIRKKIKKAVTDSGSEIKYDDTKPALKNLINIYSGFSGKSPKEIEKMYAGKGYGDFKNDLAEVVVSSLQPIQEKMSALSDEEVLQILKAGAEKVGLLAKKKMEDVKKKVGFIF